MPANAAASSRENFVELDCLRGIAITLVFAIHVDGTVNPGIKLHPNASFWQAWIYGGHTAPTLFFVLSAFLLSRPFLAELRGGGRVDIRSYFSRRFLRIMPLYATAVLTAILCKAQDAHEVIKGLKYLVFLNAFPDAVAPMFPFSLAWWTVATEVEFYLLLPLMAVAARSRRGYRWARRILLTLLVSYLFLLWDWLPITYTTRFHLAHSVIGRGPAFAIGILAAALYDRFGDRLRDACARHSWRARLGGDVVLVGALWALGLLLQSVVTSGRYVEMEMNWPLWRVGEALLWATVMLVLLVVPTHLKPLLSNRMWALLGITSYSIYLVHSPLLFYGAGVMKGLIPGVFNGWTPATAACVFGIAALSLAIASITYRVIELPAMRRKGRVPTWTPAVGVPVPGGAVVPAHMALAHAGDAAWLAGAKHHHVPAPTDEL